MVNEQQFWRLPITSFIDKSMRMLGGQKKLNSHSINEDQHTGLISEYVFSRWLDENWLRYEWVGSDGTAEKPKGHDFILGEDDKKYSVDVKSKKRSALVNLSYCDVHVETRQRGFNSQIYVFVNYCPDQHLAELIGWMAKSAFWDGCRVVKAGHVQPDGYKEEKDAGKYFAKDLRPMYELANNLMKEFKLVG